MKQKRKWWTVGGVIFAFYFGSQVYLRHQDAQAVAHETLEDAVPTVSVTAATATDSSKTITLPGNVEAWFQAPIYAQVAGYVTTWKKDYGAEVKKGDILAEIDAPQVKAQYSQSKADMEAQRAKYDIAELTAKRYEAMKDSTAVPLLAIAEKQADARVELAKLNAAEQRVRNFEALIKFQTIVAPYDGVVISREINVGDYVNKEGDLGETASAKNSLFTVADVHQMRLFVSVPESFGELMKPGQTADVVLPQFPNRHYTANFLTVAKGFDAQTRTVVTEFAIDNVDRSVWPNSYATVTLTASDAVNTAVTIPATALVFDEKGTQVAVVTKDKRVHFEPITVSKIMDSTVEVTSKLSTSAVIIDNPSGALLEGDQVRVVTPAPGLASNAP